MTFDQFFQTQEAMSVSAGAEYLRVAVEFFEGDDEIITFDEYCFMTRRGNEYHAIIERHEAVGDEVEVAKHVYFDHFVWECCAHDEAFLIQFYGEWLEWQGLPSACALELQMGADLTPYQTQWLRNYSDLWDRVVA